MDPAENRSSAAFGRPTADGPDEPDMDVGQRLEAASADADAGTTRVGTRTDLYVSGALLLLAVGYIARALTTYGSEARQLPVAVAVPAVVTLALVTFKTFRNRASVETLPLPAEESDGPQTIDVAAADLSEQRQLALNARWSLFWIAVALALPLVFGFVVGFPLLLVSYLRLRAQESWLFTLIYTVVFSVAVYVFFVAWVDIPPYDGLLGLEIF